MKAATIRKTTWDSTLQWMAGLAWLLSVWALAASASGAEIRTAVVPTQERDTAQSHDYSIGFNNNNTFNNNETFGRDRFRTTPVQNFLPANGIGFGGNQNAGDCPNGNCNLRRPNYRQLFDAPSFDNRPYETNRPVYNGDRQFEGNRSFINLTPVSLPAPNDNRFQSPNFNSPQFGSPQYDAPNFNQGPVDPYSVPAPGSAKVPTPREKIEYRYADPLAVQLGRSSNMGSATNLLIETSNLIDSRHVSPVGYEARTAAALQGVATAIGTESFMRAAGVNASPTQVSIVQEQLRQLASRPARSSSESVGQMQQAASLVSRSLRVPEGMVAMEFVHSTIDSLDRFSAIVPRKSAIVDDIDFQTANVGTDLELRTAGLEENIVGVGVEMKTDSRGAIVLGTVDGGPAAQSGVRKGDIIVGVNGRSVSGMSLGEIAQMIGGPVGSNVTFNVERNGQNGSLAMTRRSMYVSSVANVEMIDANNGVGYARLKQFSANSAKDLEAAMWKLHGEGMKSFVLDLRGNPGGLLTSAIDISNLYLPCGQIVSTRGRNADDNTQEVANYTKTWKTPLVVLVDDGSASASEILAAAIQDNERGVVAGRRSYGKGTVQTHFPLRAVSGNLKLTTAKFYSPKGREMAGAGVIPDITVNAETDWSLSNNQDRDVQAAMNVLADGRPQMLATNAVKCYRNAAKTNGFAR